MAAGGYDNPDWWGADGWAWGGRAGVSEPAMWGQTGWDAPEQPVVGVSWYEADAYARWAGKRLPTDGEWEKSARGEDGRRYPWGNDWPSAGVANFNLYVGRTTPVGLYLAGVSPYGCHDMAGNVNNWTADWYWPRFARYCVAQGLLSAPLMNDELRRRLETEEITDKIDRGGGFATPLIHHEVLGCTRKIHWPPHTREPWNGFRTAADTIPSSSSRSDQ